VLEAVPEDSEGRDTIIERIVAATMPGSGRQRSTSSATWHAFAASDQAGTITGSTINIACGTTVNSEDRRAGPSPFACRRKEERGPYGDRRRRRPA
jgi:hypothetical protein